MDNKDMEKLNQAIHILVNDQLKIDADDTLFEKLCSYIQDKSLSSSDSLLLFNEIEESIKSNSPPLPPLPPLMISPTKSGPTSSGLKPPTPPPMMTPLELISSKPFN